MSTTGERIGLIRLPSLHPGQRIVLRHPARIKILCAGRRWRKTALLMVQAVNEALLGKQILWAAPSWGQAFLGHDEVERGAGNVALLTQSEAKFPGGGLIRFVSMEDYNKKRGFTADGLVIDEAGDLRPQSWYDVLRPTISDTRGWAILASTPYGTNWFYEEWKQAKNSPDAMSWQAPTLGARLVSQHKIVREPHPLENPDFRFDELEAIARGPEHTFRREYLADFEARSAGLVFPFEVPVAKNLASFFDFKAARTTP